MLKIVYLVLLVNYIASSTILENEADMNLHVTSQFLQSKLRSISKDRNPRAEYSFLDFLGSGTSGNVYLVVERSNRAKKFSAKVYPARTRRGLAHGIREASALKVLKGCKGVPQLEDMYMGVSRFYLIESLINGDILKDLDVSRLSHQEAKDIEAAIYAIFRRIEERGICHHDISLSNIMYDAEEGKVYLIDFGDARLIKNSEFPYLDFEPGDGCADERDVKRSLREWSAMTKGLE